jgi:hypothetical protein
LYQKQIKRFKRRIFFKNFFLRNFFLRHSFIKTTDIHCILNSRIIFSKKVVFFFKKKFKKFFFKSNIKFRINIIPNYSISYKGKNPRMGRGAGFYSRSTIIHKPFKIFFKTSNLSESRGKKISYFFKKKLSFVFFNF